jgi:predicted O-methyltransferase YrrM
MSNSIDDKKDWLVKQEALNYIRSISVKESKTAQSIKEVTTTLGPKSIMQISSEEGQFLSFLVKLINAKKTLEIGVFTGYSTLCIAEALPKDGQIIAMDVSKEFTDIAQDQWKKSGVQDKINLILAPASETMDKLIKDSQEGTFDFAFIE